VRVIAVVGLVLGVALMHGLVPGGHEGHAVAGSAVHAVTGSVHAAPPAHAGQDVPDGVPEHASATLPADAGDLVAAGSGLCLAVLLTGLLLRQVRRPPLVSRSRT